MAVWTVCPVSYVVQDDNRPPFASPSQPRIMPRIVFLILLVAVVALFLQLVVLFGDVIARAFFQAYLPWTDEVGQLAMMILTFAGGIVATAQGRHMAVHAVVARLPLKWRAVTLAAADWVTVVASAFIAFESWTTLRQEWGQRSSILQLPLEFFTVCLTGGLLLLSLVAMMRLLHERPKWAIERGAVCVALFIGMLVLLRRVVQAGPGPQDLVIESFVVTVLVLAGVPIAFSLASAALTYLYVAGTATMVAVPLNMELSLRNFVLLAVPYFILTGAIMAAGGLSKRLAECMVALIGNRRGSLLQVLVATMFIFSGISGSKVADVAAVGTPMRDILRRTGYDAGESAGVLSAAAAAGETIPPSIAMLVLGTVTSLSISALFAAGILPAIVISLGLVVAVYWRARTSATGSVQVSWQERVRRTLVASPALILPVILVGGIVTGIATPTEASSVAVVLALLVSVVAYRELRLVALWQLISDVIPLVGAILLLVSAAGAYAWSLTIGQAPQQIGEFMATWGTNNVPLFLAMTIVTLVIMGALFEGLPAILIFGPLLLPVAIRLGISPLHYGIVFLVALGVGASAPPVGIVTYVAASVLGITMETAARPTIVYLTVVLLALILVAAVPWLTLALPHAFHLIRP